MKKIVFYLFGIGIIVTSLYLSVKLTPTTYSTYDLNETEKKFHINMVKYGKSIKSAERLWLYYRYTAKDSNQSFYWLKHGAILGSPSMEYNVGQKLIYSSKNEDIQKGLYWLKKSAKNNFQWAQCELGLLYEEGDILDKNITKSDYYYTLAGGKNNCWK